MAKKIGEDLEKKFVRGNDKTLKIDHVNCQILKIYFIISYFVFK
jgi:hypothetical protein